LWISIWGKKFHYNTLQQKINTMTKTKIIIAVSSVVLAIILGGFIFGGKKDQTITFNTQPVGIGTVSMAVTATGAVQPVDQVEVGTQVSGIIRNIYVDYNDQVKKGQVLAELDKLTLNTVVAQVRANLRSAENELDFQQKNFNRVSRLYETRSVSETAFEEALYRFNSAQASVERIKTELKQAEINLQYATVYSPIDGVVLARSVDEGQTVAASLSAPTLFTIAKDLTKMQVAADVDEADIGQVRAGQKVYFTVDAYPDDEFEGVVRQVRLSPTITSNVVTYVVIIEAENPDLKLMPGLTATVTIITNQAEDVLTVPVMALRFQPDPEWLAEASEGSNINITPVSHVRSKKPETVWIKSGNDIFPRQVQVGLSDGAISEIKDGVEPGEEVVLSISTVNRGNDRRGPSVQSPFIPGGRTGRFR
jgi:HlyD family secretion protein